MALINNFQDRVKVSSNAVALILVKILTGLFLGLTFALIGEEIIAYGWLSFLLVITVTTATLFRVMRSWSWMHVLIFNLICVLTGLLLYMYILIAPG
ncbi:MAG: hypothetical protein HC902_08670 [Calothrix sp. SM1_5_4]|nr:hypothetical protein [Calothrix sp. SM1_5_4]